MLSSVLMRGFQDARLAPATKIALAYLHNELAWGPAGAFRSVKRGKKALTIGPNVRAYAFHPGTKGRGFWDRNKATARRVTTTVYKQAALPSMLREAGFG